MNIKIETNVFDCGKMYRKDTIEFYPGITILVGCNGSGKSTLITQIEDVGRYEDKAVLSFNNLSNGARSKIGWGVAFGDIEFAATLINSSEGESISIVISREFKKISKELDRRKKNNEDISECIFLMDAVDSGLSIDNIIDLKEALYIISEKIKEKYSTNMYFIISANSYEMANGERCFDVAKCEYVNFSSYDDYRKFIIKSKKTKISRDNRWNRNMENKRKKQEEKEKAEEVKNNKNGIKKFRRDFN